MRTSVVHLSTPRAAIRQAVSSVPTAVVRGTAQQAQSLLVRVGLALLGRIRAAFVVKARGGTDEAGDRWAPLSPKTVAYGRRGGRTRAEKNRDARPSQALNRKQQERWWDLYRQGLAMYGKDRRHAARRAWLILKGEGAQTLFDKYSSRPVEILRDTGLLLNSLSPGAGSTEQVFRVGSGSVTVGTNRKGARAHHKGVPGRLPQRRLWPAPRRWPPAWWQDIIEQARDVLVLIVLENLRGAR